MNPLPSSNNQSGQARTIVVGSSGAPSFHTHPASAITGDVDALLPGRLKSLAPHLDDCNSVEAIECGFWSADIFTANTPDTSSYWNGMSIWNGTDTVTGNFAEQWAYETTGSFRVFRRTLNVITWNPWEQIDRDFYDTRYLVAADTTPPQAVQSADVTPNGTTPSALTGLSIAVTSPGTSAVYMVEIGADVSFVGSQTNIIELLVDGAAQTAQLITGAAATGYRINGSKTWRITGLAAGSRTFTAQTKNSAAGTNATVKQAHTLMTVQRVA